MKDKNYVNFVIPQSNVIVETKDKLLIELDKNNDYVFWVNKKQASSLNQFKLAFNLSFCMDKFEGKEPFIIIYKNNSDEVVERINPLELAKYFRKIG